MELGTKDKSKYIEAAERVESHFTLCCWALADVGGNAYDLAIANSTIEDLQATIERQRALLVATNEEWGEKAEFLSSADQAIRD